MKTTIIAVLFVASVLSTWIGVVSENLAEAGTNWNRDNSERFHGKFDFLDRFFGFALLGEDKESILTGPTWSSHRFHMRLRFNREKQSNLFFF